MIAVKEVMLSEIPERKPFGQEETPRSKWAKELLSEFQKSKAGIWEIVEDENGKPINSSKKAASISSSLSSQTKRKEFANIQSLQRGSRVFISKVKVINGGTNEH